MFSLSFASLFRLDIVHVLQSMVDGSLVPHFTSSERSAEYICYLLYQVDLPSGNERSVAL